MDDEVKSASPSDPPHVEQKQATGELPTCSLVSIMMPCHSPPTDNACYIYTSGTTGFPKACQIPHVKYSMVAFAFKMMTEIISSDVLYATLPLYHSSAGIITAGQTLFYGSTLVIRDKFSASNFWTDCIKYKCTVSFREWRAKYAEGCPVLPTRTCRSSIPTVVCGLSLIHI